MVWAAPYLPVPVVVTLEELGKHTVLLTEALPGRDATHPAWRADLPALVRALGRGLRAFHEPWARNGAPSASTWRAPWPTSRNGCARRHRPAPASTRSTPI